MLTAMLAGAALVSVVLARYGDRVGAGAPIARSSWAWALAGTVFALTDSPAALMLAALTGTISADIVESGPFTSLEQAMLPHAAAAPTRRGSSARTTPSPRWRDRSVR